MTMTLVRMMWIRKWLVVGGLAGLATACSRSEKSSPNQVVERYYADSAAAGASIVANRPLIQQDTEAVFATSLRSGDSVAEWYTFLKWNGTHWDVAAARTMQFPQAYYTLIDSIQHGWEVPSSRPELRANLALTVSSDSAIKAYLLAHRAVMDSLVQIFKKRAVLNMVEVGGPIRPEVRDGKVLPTNRNKEIERLLEQARVSTAFRDARYPGCTFIRISGMGRKQVGYLYAQEGCTIPRMTPNRFIYVDNIVGPWYVYKAI
jgi:hypothetical protein